MGASPEGVQMVGRTKPPYPAEFEAEAVQLARSSGQPLRLMAQDPGVSVEALRSWVKQAAVDAGERAGLTSEERAELSRLRRENRVLREEREILRKVAVPPGGSTANENGARVRHCGWTARA